MPEIKNKLKCKAFTIFLTVAFVLLTPSFTLAAEGGVSWQVENFGVFQTPAKWQTIKLEEVLDRLDNIFKELPAVKPKDGVPSAVDPEKLQADFTNTKNLVAKILKEENVNIYQIVLDDNNAYYVANLLLFKENKPMKESEAAYFAEKTTKKTRQDFAATIMALQNEAINSAQIWSNVKPTSDIGFKVFPAGPVEQLTVKNTPAYGIGTRVIVNAFGLTAPYYVKAYVFNLDDHRAYAILWSLDSERAFWNKTFKPIISSLQ